MNGYNEEQPVREEDLKPKQRVIKFRAWDVYNDRMVYDPDRFEPAYTDDEKLLAPWIFYETWQDREDGIRRSCHIMQFCNETYSDGSEVYEGDIYEYDYEYDSDYDGDMPIVKHSTGRGFVRSIFDCWQILEAKKEGGKVKVIGNIYEHPNLLK